jgi:hypothetical protein
MKALTAQMIPAIKIAVEAGKFVTGLFTAQKKESLHNKTYCHDRNTTD